MKPVLLQLGLNEKEARFYLYLLREGLFTASQLAKRLHESRTNTYMVLERLIKEKLVVSDGSAAVKRFAAADPKILNKKLDEQESRLHNSRQVLKSALPKLGKQYEESQQKIAVAVPKKYLPLVESFAGAEGVVKVILTDAFLSNSEAVDILGLATHKRTLNGLATNAVVTTNTGDSAADKLKHAGLEIRYSAERPSAGSVFLLAGKVAVIAEKPKFTATITDNEMLVATFTQMFGELWAKGKGGKS